MPNIADQTELNVLFYKHTLLLYHYYDITCLTGVSNNSSDDGM